MHVRSLISPALPQRRSWESPPRASHPIDPRVTVIRLAAPSSGRACRRADGALILAMGARGSPIVRSIIDAALALDTHAVSSLVQRATRPERAASHGALHIALRYDDIVLARAAITGTDETVAATVPYLGEPLIDASFHVAAEDDEGRAREAEVVVILQAPRQDELETAVQERVPGDPCDIAVARAHDVASAATRRLVLVRDGWAVGAWVTRFVNAEGDPLASALDVVDREASADALLGLRARLILSGSIAP